MKTVNSGMIYLYNINWGPNVQADDFYSKKQIYRSLKTELSRIFGTYTVPLQDGREITRDSFIWIENFLFSQTKPE